MKLSFPIVLSVVYGADAILWVLASLPVMHSLLRHHELPQIGPIKSFSGPFSDSLEIDTMLPLILLFVFVSALKLLAAYWLWQFRIDGAILGLILTGVSVFFWYGFFIPIGPLLGVVEVILTALAWSSLQ